MKGKTSNKVKKNENKYLITILLTILIAFLIITSCGKTKPTELAKSEEETDIGIVTEQVGKNLETKIVKDKEDKSEVIIGKSEYKITNEKSESLENQNKKSESSHLEDEVSLSSSVDEMESRHDKLEPEKKLNSRVEPRQDADPEAKNETKNEREVNLKSESEPRNDEEFKGESQAGQEKEPEFEQESEARPSEIPFEPYYMPAVGSHGLYDSYIEAVYVAESIESEYWNKIDNLEDPGWEWSGWEVYPVWHYFAPEKYIEYYTVNFY